jgi:hypothetical protein
MKKGGYLLHIPLGSFGFANNLDWEVPLSETNQKIDKDIEIKRERGRERERVHETII